MILTATRGLIAAARGVKVADEIVVTSSDGIVFRQAAKSISLLGWDS
jgi:hypothetical protein